MKRSTNLAEFLNKDIADISDTELMEIIDAELEKDEAEIDTGLVDECLLILENRKHADNAVSQEKPVSKKRKSFIKIILAAAVICAVTATGFVLGLSEKTEINIPEEYAYYGDNCIEIKRESLRTQAAGYNTPDCELKQKFVSVLEIEPTLPKALCQGYEIVDEHTQDKVDETDTSVTHSVSLQNENGNVSIDVVRDDTDWSKIEAVARSSGGYMNPLWADMINANGMDIAIIENKNDTVFVEYYDGNISYYLRFNNGFTREQVVEIMKTVC